MEQADTLPGPARVYRRRFRVRVYEVGADGHVRDSVYFNYCQQAAVEASAAVGYDIQRYEQLGTVWVIRDQTIVYLTPLKDGDELEVETWVSDFRRVRSHREYVLRRLDDGTPAALARADWVYVDQARMFPKRISAQMACDFGVSATSALDLAPPLEAARPLDMVPFIYRCRARWHEQDDLRHVNNANYLHWLDQARREAWRTLGRAPADFKARPVHYALEYVRPVLAGDEIEVQSRIVAVGETQCCWEQQVLRDDQLLLKARATLKGCQSVEALNR